MGKRIPITEQYWRDRSKVDPATGCWVWQGSVGRNGYGAMKRDGKYPMPHRMAYETFHGPIPPGMVICHSCDNRICVNPDHLRADTQKGNIGEMHERGRAADRRGENGANARLTWEQVRAIRADIRTNRAIAQVYGVDPSHISRIKSGKYWAAPIAEPETTL